MGQAQPKSAFTLEDYMAWEAAQAERHEFVRGEVFAMVGARRVHNLVAGNVFASLKQQLKGSACRAFIESAKVRVADDAVFYPDVFVTCDRGDLRTEHIFTAPTLVVEVLSPSTEAYDRGGKFTLYRRLASLHEYLLIDPDTREVQLFRRGADGLFTLHDFSGVEVVECASIGCTLSAADLFDGLDLPDEDPPAV